MREKLAEVVKVPESDIVKGLDVHSLWWMLMKNNTWEKTNTDINGRLVEWNLRKLSWLLEDVANKERLFLLAKENHLTGEKGETLETVTHNVLGHMLCDLGSGKIMTYKQHYTERKREILPDGGLGEPIEDPLTREKVESSVSGKLPVRGYADPVEKLQEEIEREYGLRPDTYQIVGKPQRSEEYRLSNFYPGLLTHQFLWTYEIWLKPEFYRERFEEESRQTRENGYETSRVHVFIAEPVQTQTGSGDSKI